MPQQTPIIRAAEERDSEGIARIYNHYIAGSTITFEEEAVSAADMCSRLAAASGSRLPWLVCESSQLVKGYAYASKWNDRSAYRFTAEVTAYLAPDSLGAGLGTTLYEALFDELRRLSYHTVIAGIALPNTASIALHENFGMEKVAHFSEVGYKFGRWVDVGYWQGTLDV
jgi:phosphinothricin acetyltransferase